MKIHEVKLNIPFFDEVVSGAKTFEIRKNDREFEEGDVIHMFEFDSDSNMKTGEVITKQIGFVTEYAQQEGYVVFSLL